ncbi:LysR family transcriptional regulator [Rahnella woolbedingensis]|uniref:LysR family transcriptional regulator n=1 Tax=Rahnella woolbedingensis TaxID=1510574 RepID=A0A419NDX0_9GAMM|nr:LysR family transcriptional regulator [Rahnella woolbedingensis]RJT46823.1 LysR family transcriptional regulator [Rahnella woolbedingensis]
MNDISIKKLQVVNALIENGSATNAAKMLNISPSSISYTLKKLQDQLGVPLFRREKEGLKPNVEAYSLQEQYNEVMGLNTTRKTFIITTYALVEFLLADYIHDFIREKTLHFVPMDVCENERLRKLKHREVDIDIGGRLPEDVSIISERYLYSDMCILVRENHPSIKNKFTLEDWHQNQHLRWQRDRGSISNMVDGVDASERYFNERDIAWESPNLLTLAYLCSGSDHIMMVPEVFTKSLISMLPLKSFVPPPSFEMKFKCYLHYHRALEKKISSLGLYNIFNTHLDDVLT